MTPLEEYMSEYPYRVYIKHDFDPRIRGRGDWLRAQPGGYHQFIAGAFGWIYGDNCASIYCITDSDPWTYIFKDAKIAVEFKLRFG